MEIKQVLLAGVLTGALAGCGGSDSDGESSTGNTTPTYTGSRDAAVLSSKNSGDLALAAVEAVKSAEADDARSNLPGLPASASSTLGVSRSIAALQSSHNILQTQIINGGCGGTMSVSGSGESTAVNFDDYCEAGLEIDGAYLFNNTTVGHLSTTVLTYQNVSIKVDESTVLTSGTFTTVYNTQTSAFEYSLDITMTVDGEKIRLVESESCDAQFNCTSTATFTVNGETYEAENVTYESTVSGSHVTARVYDADEGYFEMEAKDITYCDNGNIESGNITLSDGDESRVDITFDGDCQNMTVTIDAVAETVAQ